MCPEPYTHRVLFLPPDLNFLHKEVMSMRKDIREEGGSTL